MNSTAHIFHALADQSLVNIQGDVIHTSMGPPCLFLNQRVTEFSLCNQVPQAPRDNVIDMPDTRLLPIRT
jgi:hypothetical protein